MKLPEVTRAVKFRQTRGVPLLLHRGHDYETSRRLVSTHVINLRMWGANFSKGWSCPLRLTRGAGTPLLIYFSKAAVSLRAIERAKIVFDEGVAGAKINRVAIAVAVRLVLFDEVIVRSV